MLVVVLLGGFTVNLVWCLFLNYKNRSAGDYTKAGAPLAANVLFASVAGVIWYSQFAIYKVADAKSGELSFAGWTVLMCSMVIFSTLLGILMREWKGVSVRTTSLLAASLVVLVLALVAIGYGNYLKPSVTDGTIAKVDAATLVVHTADDTEQTFPLDAKTIILLGDQRATMADLKVGQTVTAIKLRTAPLTIRRRVTAARPRIVDRLRPRLPCSSVRTLPPRNCGE